MATTTGNEKKLRLKRRRTSLIFYALLATAGTSGRFDVDAFGVKKTERATGLAIYRMNSSLHMKIEKSPRQPKSRTINGSTSVDLISRKAALVDSSSNSSSNDGIRERVNRFLRSKKKKLKVVEEVKDIESIYTALGEGQKEAIYTAVIFHAPYCRACKASMPLFEELARQYNKKNKNYSRHQQQQQQKKRPWLAADSQESSHSDPPRKQPVVKFISVPVTQDNSKELQDQFSVTKFPLAHIYDPVDGLVDELPLLRKLFPKFKERLESVLVESTSSYSSPDISHPIATQSKNSTTA